MNATPIAAKTVPTVLLQYAMTRRAYFKPEPPKAYLSSADSDRSSIVIRPTFNSAYLILKFLPIYPLTRLHGSITFVEKTGKLPFVVKIHASVGIEFTA